MDYYIFQQMRSSYFNGPSDINNYLLINNPVADPTNLYNDPYYGLANAANYAHWQTFGLPLNADDNGVTDNKILAWVTEVRFYFRLSPAQV